MGGCTRAAGSSVLSGLLWAGSIRSSSYGAGKTDDSVVLHHFVNLCGSNYTVPVWSGMVVLGLVDRRNSTHHPWSSEAIQSG
ncbi:hypothetical protein D3C75_1215870 [compost metagenome]